MSGFVLFANMLDTFTNVAESLCKLIQDIKSLSMELTIQKSQIVRLKYKMKDTYNLVINIEG